jgi:hypothetical protein
MAHVSDLAGLPSAVAGATAVLVRSPGLHEERDPVCATLSMGGSPDAAVAVTYRSGADEWLDRVQGHRGNPAAVHVIAVGDGTPTESTASVDHVESPGNLTGLEIAVNRVLDTFEGDQRATLCFDSVTAFLQYVDLEDAYRYLHALIERLWAAGVVGHFHVDPGAHDEETLNSLTGLFDAVVDLGPETTADGTEGVAVRTSPGVGPDGAEGGGPD